MFFAPGFLTMKFPALFHRRKIWVPGIWGWILILGVIAGTLLLSGRYIYPFLAHDEPSGARLLVIEGWMAPEELDQALDRFRRGHYNSIITTGGPVSADLTRQDSATYAVLARNYLVQHGIKDVAITAVPAPKSAQDRTYLSAVMVREWLKKSGQSVDALDVHSSGVHSRRTQAVYRMAFGPDIRIGIFAARPEGYAPEVWWTTSTGAKTVLTEAISWIWTKLFFHPPAPGSHAEKWGLNPVVKDGK